MGFFTDPEILKKRGSASPADFFRTPQIAVTPQRPTTASTNVQQNVARAIPADSREVMGNQLLSLQADLDKLRRSRIDTDITPDFNAESFRSEGLSNTTSQREIEAKRRKTETDLLRDNLLTPSEREIELQEQFNRATSELSGIENQFNRQRSDLDFNVEGLFGSGQDVRTGQLTREETLQVGAARNIQEGLLDALNVEQNIRGAKIEDLQRLQEMTTPGILGQPQVNQSTGEVTVFQQDPTTGAVTPVSIGNMPVDPTFDMRNVITNEATGQKFAVGVRPGETEPSVIPLQGTSGLKPLASQREGGEAISTGTPGISPITNKPFTTAQSQAGTFAARMDDAEDILGDSTREIFSATVGEFIPSRLKSSERKQFEQAEKSFITAVLRRESGAAISAEEFKDARTVYIPEPGDEAEELAQKALARETVKQGLINESVGAFDQLEGVSVERPNEEGSYTSSSGKTYNLPN